MLLLLFSDQVAAAASADVVTTMLVETAPGTWYDATSDLVSGTVTRGKQTELDQYQAGVADVVLDNDDRKYDPTYTASPLNGYIRPMTRVQLRNTYNGVTWPMFAGYADRWTQNRDGPHRGTASLVASDGLKVLGRSALSTSAYAQEVTSDEPVAWWRLGDAAGSTSLADSAGALPLTSIVGGITLGVAPLTAHEADTAITTAAVTDYAIGYGPLPVINAPCTIECVIKTASGPVVDQIVGTYASPGVGFYLDSLSGTARFQVANGTTFAIATSTTTFNDNLPHVLTGTYSSDGRMRIYIDGVDQTTGPTTLAPLPLPSASGFALVGKPTGGNGFVGTIDEVSVYNTALAADRVLARYQAFATAWAGDLPGARVTRILDRVDWPADLRDIDAGVTALQAPPELNMTALEHLQTVAATEFGDLYVNAAGTLVFEDRAGAVDQPVAATFSDAPGGDLPITFSNAEISDDQVRNVVTVNRLGGNPQAARDATSVATYQPAPYDLDGLYHTTDDHSRNLARFILNGYKDPVERVSSMAVNPYRDPAALWPAVLALELTDRVVLNETPQNVAPEVARTCVVEGISHTFSAKAWSASFNLSENTTATQAYWQLGVAGYSELGETTRLFF